MVIILYKADLFFVEFTNIMTWIRATFYALGDVSFSAKFEKIGKNRWIKLIQEDKNAIKFL